MTNGSDTRLREVPVPWCMEVPYNVRERTGMVGGRGKKMGERERKRTIKKEHSAVYMVTFSIIKEDNVWTG